MVDGGACKRRRLERFDVPQPICRIDGGSELGDVDASCDKAVSSGGIRTDGDTSQSNDCGDVAKRESQYSRLSNDGVVVGIIM
jgi:hypothetical protein